MQTAKRERTTHDHNQQETRWGIIVGFSIRATCGDCDDPGHCRSHDQCHYTGTALDANGQGISIVEINDETTEVHVNGTHVTTLTHDEDGWQGMRRVEACWRKQLKAELKRLEQDLGEDDDRQESGQDHVP